MRSTLMSLEVKDLHALAESLVTSFAQGGVINYINQAIVFHREVLELCPPGHPKRSICLTLLSKSLNHRYKQLGTMEDIEEGITLEQEALELRPPGHPDRSISLSNLANCLGTRYEQLGEMEDLNEAIVLNRAALQLRPLGHPDRSISLNSLAVDLYTRYKQLGGMDDLDQATVLNRDALALRPLGHPDRSSSLNNLAVNLSTRYKQLGVMDDLDETIILNRAALELRPPGHPNRPSSLNNLAADLYARYKQLGGMEDLNEATVLNRDALALRPLGHPDRSSSLNNLAVSLSALYKHLGGMDDLNEAIALNRAALELRPLGHPSRSSSLNNLAVDLSTRYKQLGVIEDLNEAIALNRTALELRPLGRPIRSSSLNNLAIELSTRYKQLGVIEDLNEAIFLDRAALELRPPGHPDRPLSLNNLATNLSIRYGQLGEMGDLNEAIVLNRAALELCPPGHLDRSLLVNNLSVYLSTRYKKLGSMEDLDEATALTRAALALCPPGDPDRPWYLDNLAGCLYTRFTQSSQLADKEELFCLYAQLAYLPQVVFSSNLSAARAWIRVAEDFQHPTILLAYKTSLRLLTHHLAALPSLPQHFTVFRNHTSSLAADAFSACLRHHSPTDAVELLEQGRCVFWSQLTRLRPPLEDVIASGSAGRMLTDEFTQLTLHIRNALDSPGAYQHDQVCNLNVELERVVARVRSLPGLSRFLLPSPFSDLQQAAREGPIIIVNASEYGCDALIVLIDQDPVHIPLSITKEGVRGLSSRIHTLTVRAKSTDVTKGFAITLRELWDGVVSPIVDALQVICPSQSRIWWCPTAEFSSIPLHAAGPYRKGRRNLAGLYISSYTSTLAALIRARRHGPSYCATKAKRFIAIGQATPRGMMELVSIGAELTNVGQRVNGLTTFTRIEGSESCIGRVTEELGKNDWIHFACHAVPKPRQPFESAFVLHDGDFTIQRIIQCNLENPEFAYLSASHTTVGDRESPDEAIHLASAMQFVGFRSVIGTMWAVNDDDTIRITSMFYDNMKDGSDQLDHTRAAFALHKTMKKLSCVPLAQRILYVHIGA